MQKILQCSYLYCVVYTDKENRSEKFHLLKEIQLFINVFHMSISYFINCYVFETQNYNSIF